MRTIQTLKVGISTLVIVLAGCVPNATVYYRPSVNVASTHEKSHCVPIENHVLFDIKTKSQTLTVRAYGTIYSTSRGEFAEGQYVINGNWQEIKYINDKFYITTPDIAEKVAPIKIYGEVHRYDGYSSFNSGAVFPRPKSDTFDVTFPPLLIDDEEVELPVLHIKRTIWMGISPFNC
jgi:hypothetical protein